PVSNLTTQDSWHCWLPLRYGPTRNLERLLRPFSIKPQELRGGGLSDLVVAAAPQKKGDEVRKDHPLGRSRQRRVFLASGNELANRVERLMLRSSELVKSGAMGSQLLKRSQMR